MIIAKKSKQAERKITVLRGSVDNDESRAPPLSSVTNTEDASPPSRMAHDASSHGSSSTTGAADASSPPGSVQNASGDGTESRIDVIDVVAPAGKLGVTLDSPPGGGTPFVGGVNDSSPLKGKLCLGDKVIAIDDEDVSKKMAVDVSSKLPVVYALLIVALFPALVSLFRSP